MTIPVAECVRGWSDGLSAHQHLVWDRFGLDFDFGAKMRQHNDLCLSQLNGMDRDLQNGACCTHTYRPYTASWTDVPTTDKKSNSCPGAPLHSTYSEILWF